MKIQFIPVAWIERSAASLKHTGMAQVCHAHLAFEDQRVTERRWLERRLEARASEERRDANRRTSELEQAVYDNLLEFCTPVLQARLNHKLAARQSARLLKAA